MREAVGRILDSVSELVFDLDYLVTHEQFEVHAQRVRFYSDSGSNVTTDLLTQIAHDSTGLELQAITHANAVRMAVGL